MHIVFYLSFQLYRDADIVRSAVKFSKHLHWYEYDTVEKNYYCNENVRQKIETF